MRLERIVCTSALFALLAGCSTTAPTSPPAPTSATTPSGQATVPAVGAPISAGRIAAPSAAATQIPAHLDPSNPIAKDRSVFFDYDDFSIKREHVNLIQLHGKYLAANPTLSIRIEGHADERGSTEYNLALGQKRAQAVFAALRLQGTRDAQIEAISWGEERPRNTAGDEAAWAENRRADIAYPKR